MRLFGFGYPLKDSFASGSSGRVAIRGREQQLIDSFGGVGSERVGNRIRGVSKINRNGRIYHDASSAQFGEIAPYTGNF